jgi:hypothetical protein
LRLSKRSNPQFSYNRVNLQVEVIERTDPVALH